jgi:serine/threonine protein kinase
MAKGTKTPPLDRGRRPDPRPDPPPDPAGPPRAKLHAVDGEGELQPGESVGAYRLESILGEGAVGVVFRATRDDDGAVVALKVLKRQLSRDEVYRRRFVHEARVAAEVEHKHLVPILDAGEADGRSYLAVKYVAGRSLEERIRDEGPLPLDEILRLAAQAGAGLDALHRQGLVHRDIKSSNIMLNEQGDAALTDFGLAKGPAYTVLTRPGQVMGTLDYMAPELIKGEPASPASDIYAFGCVVYECISGSPPFAHKSMLQVGLAHLGEEPPDPLASRPDLPKELSWAALQALAKEPEKRPPTATAYGHMLRVSGKGSIS